MKIRSKAPDYGVPASLSSIVGNWTLTRLDASTLAVSIAGSGASTGVGNGCAVSGTVTPRPSGKNIFDVVVNSGCAPCAEPGSTITIW